MNELFRGLAAIAMGDVSRRLRALGFGLLGVVAAIVGICFLIGAGVIVLAQAYGPLAAELIAGGVFVLAALILFFVANRLGRPPQPKAPKPGEAPGPFPVVLAAFLYGFAKGSTRKKG